MSTRVLHIIPTLDRCGAEKQLVLLASGLPRDQFDVHVCALTRGGPRLAALQQADIPTTVIGKRRKIDPQAWWRLTQHVRAVQPDIVHTWLLAANTYGRAAAMAAGVKHRIAAERCVDPWKLGHELVVDRCLARWTDYIVTNSRGVRDFYVAKRLPAEKMVVIPNGVELEAPPAPVAREALLGELGLPDESRIIGVVGRLWPQKRIKDIIWAADLIKRVRDDVHVLVIGDGPQRWRLERFCRQVEIEDKVHFLGERGDVLRLMPHFDVLWLASGYEGQSNAVLEAMAAGVPVVATDIPGTRDLVVPGETGYLVPVGDRAALGRWAQVLLDDADLAARFGRAAQKRVQRQFSVEQMVELHAALYRQVMRG